MYGTFHLLSLEAFGTIPCAFRRKNVEFMGSFGLWLLEDLAISCSNLGFSIEQVPLVAASVGIGISTLRRTLVAVSEWWSGFGVAGLKNCSPAFVLLICCVGTDVFAGDRGAYL